MHGRKLAMQRPILPTYAEYTLCFTRMGSHTHTRTGTNTHMGEARISRDTCMGQEILPIRVSAAHNAYGHR